jgi:hypothetical protein
VSVDEKGNESFPAGERVNKVETGRQGERFREERMRE